MYYLESGTPNGQVPNDRVSYNFFISFLEAKLLPLLETDLSKNATLKANIEVIENFYNVQQPLYARVDSVICFKQDSGMSVNESLSKLEILLKSSELNTLTYDQLFKVFAFNSLTNKELKTRLFYQ